MRPLQTFRLLAISLTTTLFLLGLPTFISALAPTASTTWSNPAPGLGEWVTSLPATTAVTAQNADGLTTDAAYQFSTGGAWSGWMTANLQVGGAVSTSYRITVTGLNLAEGGNFIQYRITDTNGIVSESPAFQINVDTTPPGPPLTPQVQPSGWTNTDSFTITWTNPDDANGIGGVRYKLDAAPTAPDDGVFQAGDNITSLSGLSVGVDGEHTLWLWLADQPGNADPANTVTVTLKLDRQAPGPLTNQTATPNGWTNANQFDLAWTPPADASGIAGVRSLLDAPPPHPDDGDYWAGALTGYQNYTIPGAAEGLHHLWVWPVDGAGNSAAPADAVSITLRLDNTPPGPPLTVPQVSPSGWETATNATFTITWQNPTDLSGIAGACYKLGQEPSHDRDGTCVDGNDIEQITGVTAPAPGSYHLFLWLQDTAGNIDKASRRVALDALRWDPTSPEIFVDPLGQRGLNGWYVGPIAVTLIASDTGSDLASVEYNLDDAGWVEGKQLTISAEGLHYLRARATDNAGNRTEAEPAILNLDATPPSTQATIDSQPVTDNWYDAMVTVTLTPQDATSGPAYVEWKLDDGFWMRTDTAVIDADGEHLLQFSAADRAGNVETAKSLQINIDRTPPVTSYVILPGETNESGWYTTPVSITLVPADAGIGVADTFYRINGGPWLNGVTFTLSESGEYDVEVYSVDKLNHAETPYHIPGGIRIDRDAPLPPTPIDVQPRQWTNTNAFDLTFAMPPDLSGISGVFFKVGAPPENPSDGIWHPGSSNVLREVQTPGEGRFSAYVWLRDGAGNVDHMRYGVWENELSLAYDGTPPHTEAQLEGAAGMNNWFISPVQVTLAATDTLSGVENTVVSIDGSEPLPTTHFLLSTADKHTLRFWSTDNAANVEEAQLVTVRIDPDPPASPLGVNISPQTWSTVNNFTITWTNPPDTSGIAAGMVKVGAPPLDGGDGIAVPPIGIASGITVPAEGAWDLHFWLIDQAGNADIATRQSFTKTLKFDGTPPSTSPQILGGRLAASGWYTSPVSVRLVATDSASGVNLIRYRLNGGEWQESAGAPTITLNKTDSYLLEYQAVDVAGNYEPIQQRLFKVDLHAPWPHFQPIDRYQRGSSFLLSWQAAEEPEGSGLYGFDLQSKDGRNGPWMIWGGANVPDTSGRYYGTPGHRYFFRLRARDRAGNLSPWIELPWGVYLDVLANGDFAGGALGAWQQSGVLARKVIQSPGPGGKTIFVARLGTPDYGPNVPGHDIPRDSTGTVPVGAARISQTVRIPGADVLDRPVLTLWYRIYTYDTAYSERQQRWFDTLDLRLEGPTGEILALREGLPYDQWVEGKLADLGWRQAAIPLPQSWLGESMTIHIENWNRVDGRLNTWSEIADVRVWEPYHIFLPLYSGEGSPPQLETLPLLEPGTRPPPNGLR